MAASFCLLLGSIRAEANKMGRRQRLLHVLLWSIMVSSLLYYVVTTFLIKRGALLSTSDVLDFTRDDRLCRDSDGFAGLHAQPRAAIYPWGPDTAPDFVFCDVRSLAHFDLKLLFCLRFKNTFINKKSSNHTNQE